MRLTAKERILLQLFEYAKFSELVDVPPGMAQEGIALAVGIRVQHVRQFVGPLLREGLVRERVAHVAGHRRRLKVYDLTDSGRLATARLREQVRANLVRVRDAQGVRETTVGDVLKEIAGRATLPDIVREAMEGKVVDLEALAAVRVSLGAGFVERLTEAPRLDAFVGRREELKAITQEGDGPRVFVIRGVAGIGKSSLAAKVCEQLRGSRNLYWHRIRPWDTRLSILASLADFLAAVGRPGLRAVLARGEPGKADQALREDLPGTRSVLVFDDAHEAIAEVFGFLRFLKDVIEDIADARAIILSRRAIPAYDRRDVTIRGLVQEIDLEGLDAPEIQDLLAAEPEAAWLADAARKLGGHPLFLELLRSAAQRGLTAESLKDVRAFVEEEIYAELSDGERRMMKTAALYAVPFPREAVLSDPTMSHDILRSLTARSLIRPVGADAFGVHDTIRDFFTSILTPSERQALARFAVDQLLRLSDRAKAGKDFVTALNCLSNALELGESRAQQAALCEALGDTYERLGDLPAALAAYSEAVRRMEEPESIARLHRKTAAALQVRGEMAPAAEQIEEGFKVLGGRPSIERGWLNLLQCKVASGREDWAEAREHGEAALGTFRSLGDAAGQARTLLELANVVIYSPQGDPADAEEYLTSALEASKAMGEPEFQVRVHIVLANLCANRMGNVARATRHIEGCRALEESITDPHILRSFLMLQAWFALHQLADFPAAEAFFTEAASLARRIHNPRTVVFAKYGLAHVLFLGGRIEDARRSFQESAAEIREMGLPGDEAEALWMVAECCLELQDEEGFRRVAAEFRDPRLARGVDARPLHAKVLEGLDRLVHGNRDGCRASFEDALRLAERSFFGQDAMLMGFVHFYWGVALRAMGQESEGNVHIRRARNLLEESGLQARLAATIRSEPRLVAILRRASRRSPRGTG